jgi:hypothetical protein
MGLFYDDRNGHAMDIYSIGSPLSLVARGGSVEYGVLAVEALAIPRSGQAISR